MQLSWIQCGMSQRADLQPQKLTISLACAPLHAATCPPTPAGYSWLPQQDYSHNDIACALLGAKSPTDLAAECGAVPECLGFNIFRQVAGPGVEVGGTPASKAMRACSCAHVPPVT